MRKLLWLLPVLLFLSARPAHAQLANAQGWCESGATVVISSGLQSTNQVQGSFPSCTISVSIHGGGTATIYSTGSMTPLSNPFTAQSNGRWLFYAANGEYDITMTGGGLTSPVTYSDVFITNVISGGGGGTPCITTANSIQYNNGGVFGCAAGITTPDGNSLLIKGTDPWADVTAFGARANLISSPTDNSTTGTINATSNSLAIGGIGFPGNWVNGDGITIQGAGATCTLSTPAAPTVVPSFAAGETGSHRVVNSNTGSSTYIYAIIARDKFGCLTVPGASTTISNGLSSLGLQTANITSASLSNDTMTLTTTTNLTARTLVDISGVSAGIFDGWYLVATNPGTTLTFTGFPYDSRTMPTTPGDTTSGTGGTLVYYQSNHISWTAVTGAWEYYICGERPGDSSLHLIGVTRPSDNNITDTQFEDWGATYLGGQTFPYYATDAICTGSGQNDPLTTTITAGAGTTTLTLANVATNSVSGTKVVHDAAPNILAAANSVSGNVSPFTSGTVFLPPGVNNNVKYPINSFLQLPSKLKIVQAGGLMLGETIETNGTTWDGSLANQGTAQFGTCGGAPIIGPATNSANPLIYIAGTTANQLSNLSLQSNANGYLQMISYNSNLTADCVTWLSNVGSGDYEGTNLDTEVQNGNLSNTFITNSLFNTGPDQVTDKSWQGAFHCFGSIVKLEKVNFNRRGIDGTCNNLTTDWTYRQGGITPMVAIEGGQVNTYFSMKNEWQDTEGQPIIANWQGSSPPAAGGYVILENFTGGGTSPILNGNRLLYLRAVNYTGGTVNSGAMPVRNTELGGAPYFGNVISSPYATSSTPGSHSVRQIAEPLVVQGGYSIGAGINPPTSIACSTQAGGSIPNGTYQYDMASIDYRGGASVVQPTPSASCTTTTGNNTEAITWTPALGAVTYDLYRCNTSNSCTNANGQIKQAANNWYLVATGLTGTSFNDTSSSTTGAEAPIVTAGFITGMDNTGGWGPLWAFAETTAPSCTTGFDPLFGIASGHRLSFCNNGGSVDQVVGAVTTDTLTHKTYDTAGTGNVLKINGNQVSAVTGNTSSVQLQSGATTTGDAVKFDANGNTVDAGFAGTLIICTGQIALTTGAIGSGARATNTLSCSGLSATTDSITCTFSGDTNAVTGYAPSASGGLSLKTWASTNTINVDQVNDTGGSITPGAATINCKGIR